MFTGSGSEKLLETSADSVHGLFRNRGVPLYHSIWHGQHNYHRSASVSQILCMSNFTHLLVRSCSISCSFAVTTGEPSWQWPCDTLHTCSTKTHRTCAKGRDAVLCVITIIQNKTVCKNSQCTTCTVSVPRVHCWTEDTSLLGKGNSSLLAAHDSKQKEIYRAYTVSTFLQDRSLSL